MLSLPTDHLAIYERRLYDLELKLADQSSQLEDVARMGLMITSILDLESVLAAIMEMAIRTVGGEVGCIILQNDSEFQTRISWGVDRKTLGEIHLPDGAEIVDWVMKSGEIALLNSVPHRATDTVRIDSIIVAPLISRNNPIGVLVVINKVSEPGFSDDDKLRVQMLVRFAAVAIENAELLKSKLRSQKLEQELEVARTVQQTLLPAASASFAKARIEAAYIPAGQVGGDYFDIIPLGENEFVVTVGDVSNKGVPAALMMAAVRSVFRMEAGKNRPLDKLLTDMNTFLCEQVLHSKNMFLSLAYCYFDLNQMTCTYVNAGHLPPLHFRKSDGIVTEWRTGGTLIGQFPEFNYRSETVPVGCGDKVLFYTDGVSESENVDNELFGRARVQDFITRNHAMNNLVFTKELLREVEDFRAGNTSSQIDDTTVLVVEIL
ncbi:MAG: GAF domain-containing SpoIIE family protein phosphatase [Candidatus Zixiibacteriota bacterium]